MTTIEIIREKVRRQQYEFAIPHFFEEMANDDLIFADIEMVIATGRIRRRFTRDPRSTRYEVSRDGNRRTPGGRHLPNQRDRQAAFHYDLRPGVEHEQ